ncbi:MAG: chorismate synthase [Lachnospiraceae bacterium]|nr:chorismate synthase [Lachnospiraceae bacterium]
MSSSYGENIKLTVFGESHSAGIGMTLEGIPAGANIDMDELQAFLSRRAPGRNSYSTARSEADLPEFLCGVKENITVGTPITAIIRNTDTRSKDYSQLKVTPRPGHADYTAEIKYNGFQDYAGGGHFSGRLTAPLCIAGGIVKQLLEKEEIYIISRIASIGPVKDKGALEVSTARKDFPVVDDECGTEMKEYIEKIKAEGDSAGGIIECVVTGIPAGLGDPMFQGMENRIAQVVFGIPAVKGIEFGAGFSSAYMTGSENNDEFICENGNIMTRTNNAGGILGGITNGMPLTFRTAIKPTPSISRPQMSVNLETLKEQELTVKGRHDPCIVPRAVPVIEAACALAVYDAWLGRKKEL